MEEPPDITMFTARALLPKTVRLDWRVVETNAMVSAAQGLQSEELRFHKQLDSAQSSNDVNELDLIMARSGLQ
jgi:hypothetical protein